MEVGLFIIRLAVLAALYGFLIAVVWLIWREFRSISADSAADGERPPGCLFVVDSGETRLVPGESLRIEGSCTLGRSTGNSIVLSDSSVSARHAILIYEHGCWWVQDAGSTNGTQLNGELVEHKLPLRRNDVLALGQVQLRLEDD